MILLTEAARPSAVSTAYKIYLLQSEKWNNDFIRLSLGIVIPGFVYNFG